jgi:hypothetical protein
VFCPENAAIYEALLAVVPAPYVVSATEEIPLNTGVTEALKNLTLTGIVCQDFLMTYMIRRTKA